MLATFPDPQQEPSPRILSNVAIAERLCAWKLRSYAGLARWLWDASLVGNVDAVWRALFPDEPRPESHDPLDICVAFFHLVDDNLFPLDWDCLDDLYDTYNGDVLNILGLDIPYDSWGVESTEIAFEDQAEWIKPLLAMVDPEEEYSSGGHEWIIEQGFDIPEDGFAWPRRSSDEVDALLAGLDPPLDGLATLYRCIIGDANPFFDINAGWRGMYGTAAFYWNLEDVTTLAAAYKEAEPQIARLNAYVDWFNTNVQHGTAARLVMRFLMDLEDA